MDIVDILLLYIYGYIKKISNSSKEEHEMSLKTILVFLKTTHTEDITLKLLSK